MSEQNIGSALQAYESEIWSTAETLYSNGFKASDWPKLMMPFFALMLVESRIVRAKAEKVKELEAELGESFDFANEEHIGFLSESIEHEKYGYHPELIKFNRSLASICETQPSNFYARLTEYLSKYDEETKKLLGVEYAEGTSKHLDLKGVVGSLAAKGHSSVDVLYNFTKKWASIDLSIFNNSEVTTIEEHIKHKWADISAETAGEHYTPFDVIELCTAINVAIAPIDPNGSWEVYDMTCGGGNFLFGLEDSLRETYPNLSLHSYGQEYNDQLYALGAIESRFRPSAHIKYGNTLTNDKFAGQQFGSVIGNPPYGTEWKEFATTIKNDKSGRFTEDKMPPISDSQMLFLQHAVSHMKENGVGTIVHNGSPLTSGDAGGGESNIRKHLLKELDVVHAIIQLPQNMFFNTGISTYVWVLNKAKPAHLKGQVILINAENMFTKRKKSLNKKSNDISEKNREDIVKELVNAVNTSVCQVVAVDQLMYNKVDIEITRQDEDGLSVVDKKLKDVFMIHIHEAFDSEIDEGNIRLTINNNVITEQSQIVDGFVELTNFSDVELRKKIVAAENIVVHCQSENEPVLAYFYTSESNDSYIIMKDYTIVGKGVIDIKIKKAKDGQLKIDASIFPLKEKDSEIIAFSSNEEDNNNLIDEFLNKWVKEPHTKITQKEGCEINFNKAFPKKIEIRSSKNILTELAELDKELGDLI